MGRAQVADGLLTPVGVLALQFQALCTDVSRVVLANYFLPDFLEVSMKIREDVFHLMH
jgi:hypothetical protein